MKPIILFFIFLYFCTSASTDPVGTYCDEHEQCTEDEYCNFQLEKCMKGCRYDENCDSNKYCVDGDCKVGCRSDESCNPHEICDYSTRKCKFGCRYDVTCSQNEYCSYYEEVCKIGCRSDESCQPDEYCHTDTRLCLKGCRSDDNCDIKSYCHADTRECLPGCQSELSCERKEYCEYESRLCIPGCGSHDACEMDEYCEIKEHKCVRICENSTCGENSKCSIYNRNQYCSCVDGYFPEGGVGCRPKIESDNFSNQNCSLYCEPRAACEFRDDTVFCYCPLKLLPFTSPYVKCFTPKTRLSLGVSKALMYG